jgi:hypothetical protein
MIVLTICALLQSEEAIRWTTPGNFTTAQETARRDSRLLILKGIAFGIDEEGARDATCGTW